MGEATAPEDPSESGREAGTPRIGEWPAPPAPAPAPLAPLAALAALAATLAVVVQQAVFPHGSINNDEAIYRLQAQALRHGHFFTPVVAPMAAFRPWLAAAVQNHWVLKYIPVEGGLLALAETITGSPSAALPVVAAAAAIATWLLVEEVLGDPPSATVATLLVVLSPLVVVQSALLVGYLLTLVLLEVFAWTVIRATRSPSVVRGLAGGLAFGVAAVARPYDTALFALPLIVWAVVRLRRKVGAPHVWYALGAVPPLVAMLAYDWAATGNPLRLPFNLLEPADRPGFGPRRMFPQEPYHAFGLRLGISGSWSHLLLTVLWVAGGPVLVVLAVIGLWRRRRSGLALAIAAIGVAFPVGYVFFWGAWNASKLWHGVRFVGPFYFLPLVVPVAAFGGSELVALFRRRRLLAVAVVVAGIASSALVAAPALAADARWSRQDGAVLAMVNRQAVQSKAPTLILIQSQQEYVMHPISGLANRWDGTGPLVYGLWSGTPQDLAVLATKSTRRPYVLTLFGAFDPHPPHLAATLRPVRAKSGATVRIHVSTPSTPAPGQGLTLTATATGAASPVGAPAPTGQSLPCPASPAGAGWEVAVGADGVISCAEPGGAALRMAAITPAGWEGSLRLQSATGPPLTLPLQVTSGVVTILAVGPTVAQVGRPPIGLLTAD